MATNLVSAASIQVDSRPQVGRRPRKPQHTFHTKQRPYQIQPFLLAPVLPGETMKNLLLQYRSKSHVLASDRIGWWCESYLFYVKLRDLDERDAVTEMIMGGPALAVSAARAKTYFNGTHGYDWMSSCLKRVTECYFRDEDEAYLAAEAEGLPLATIGLKHWLDSAQLDSKVQDPGEEMPGENPQLPAHMTQFAAHYEQWEAMRSMQLTAATFEDWLRSFGVTPPTKEKLELHRPELIRYIREWTYPKHAVDPAGVNGPLCEWNIAERADKDRFFAEPGFVFGVQVFRPKVYILNQSSYGAAMMNDPFSWLPAVLQDQPYTSLKKFTAAAGPLSGAGADYWVDLRDLFVHGDQFTNHARTHAEKFNAVNGPDWQAGLPRFVQGGDVEAMFASPQLTIHTDGRCDLTILSRIEDTSL